MQIGQLKPDPGTEKDGVWVDFDSENGVSFRVAYMGSTKYNDKLKRMSLAARGRGVRGIPSALETEIQVKAMVGTLLLDWKGLEDGDKPFAFTTENAVRLLTDSKEVRDFITVVSSTLSYFQKETAEETEAEPSAILKSEPGMVAEVV